MSEDEPRHEHLPTDGGEIFAESGPETVENDQTGLPSWAAALKKQREIALVQEHSPPVSAQRKYPRLYPLNFVFALSDFSLLFQILLLCHHCRPLFISLADFVTATILGFCGASF